jgi:hypothetical protein
VEHPSNNNNRRSINAVVVSLAGPSFATDGQADGFLYKEVRMPLQTPHGDKDRYIVRSGDSSLLADFIDETTTDPELELVDTIGPVGAPHTAVFLMPDEKARALQQRYGESKRIIIERDRPLSLF